MNTTRKAYISGPITGVKNAKERFKVAVDELIDMGFEPINPFDNGLADDAGWKNHMAADLRMLMDCDMIYMMEGWNASTGARIEFDMAVEMGFEVLFQSYIENNRFVGGKNDRFAKAVKGAIREVMGTDFDQSRTECKSRDVFFMRMIFTFHCRRAGMTLKQIKTYIRRDHTTMLHYLKRYADECRYNNDFRTIAAKVEKILATSVSH